jgi:hypothetical protein
MELTLYRIIAQQLSPEPDLGTVKQQGQLLPEEWPVILEKITSYRKQIQSFVVSDGKTSLVCTSDVPDLYDRIAATEIGTIIHLLGSKTVYNQSQRQYTVRIEDFMTLKQYDEHLARIREAEAKRLADLADLNRELYQYEHQHGHLS